MREFELEIAETYGKGLSPYATRKLNTPYMDVLQNARVEKGGLEPFTQLSRAYSAIQPAPIFNVPFDWPFPQYFNTQWNRLVGTRDYIYSVSDSGILTQLPCTGGYTSDELWSVADFGNYQLMTKDGTKLFIANSLGAYELYTAVSPSTRVPHCQTLCALEGQLVVGRLASWTDGNSSAWSDLGNDYYAWSKIGSIDFLLDRTNESGFRKVDWRGPIVEIKRLGNMAVIYGYNGISIVRPVMEPAPTFAYKNLSGLGLYCKGAVGGDEHEHCFVSSSGKVYKISKDLQISELGYEEQITALSGTIKVSHVSTLGDYFISDGSTCYLLSPGGMSEVFQLVSSVGVHNGEVIGVYDESEDTDFLAVTAPFDFGLRGRKTIELVELGLSGDGTFYAAVDWRISSDDAWQRTDWYEANNEGVAPIKISGVEFRLCLKNETISNFRVDRAKVRYKMDDLRSIRGIYAPPPRGQ